MDKTNWTNEYRTGRMRPRKNSSGLVALLLIVVIFLSGVVSALSLLNIRLFRQVQELSDKENTSLSFYQAGGQETATAKIAVPDTHLTPELGLRLQELSLLYQRMYHLPQGLYVTQVADSSDASAKGIVPGDVLTAFAGQEVASLDALQRLLYTHQAGDTVEVQIFRNGQLFRFDLTVGQAGNP